MYRYNLDEQNSIDLTTETNFTTDVSLLHQLTDLKK